MLKINKSNDKFIININLNATRRTIMYNRIMFLTQSISLRLDKNYVIHSIIFTKLIFYHNSFHKSEFSTMKNIHNYYQNTFA